MKKKEDEVVVYWAPAYDALLPTTKYLRDARNEANEPIPMSVVYPSWNMLYVEPDNCLDEFKSQRNKASASDNYLYCPAVADVFKNTFVYRNQVESYFKVDNETKSTESLREETIAGAIKRLPSINNQHIFSYHMFYVFFCEEDLKIEVTPPYFHKTDYSEYGAFISGTFNIGAWYREVNCDFQLWDGVDEFKISKNDPLFYARFMTDKKVVLKRFKINKEIQAISTSCRDYRFTFGLFASWEERYSQFKNSKTHKILIDLIKENLVDE